MEYLSLVGVPQNWTYQMAKMDPLFNNSFNKCFYHHLSKVHFPTAAPDKQAKPTQTEIISKETENEALPQDISFLH